MPEADLSALARGAVVAPAGHGKTEVIARTAKAGQRALVLTHTHAGVHALRTRMKRLGVPASACAVDTIAGWSLKYARAFPRSGNPPAGLPRTTEEWRQTYRGGAAALQVPAVRKVLLASYDRVLIDEYQDCDAHQHALAQALAANLPTLVFGDPMQGIFEWAGANLSWPAEILPSFPLAHELSTPHRWAGKNEELGAWVAHARERLARGEEIDLANAPIRYIQASSEFEMSLYFDGLHEREGSVAAIHCNRGMCNRIAAATKGAFQALEEIAAQRLQDFGFQWTSASSPEAVEQALGALARDAAHYAAPPADELLTREEQALNAQMSEAFQKAKSAKSEAAAKVYLELFRKHPRSRIFRRELWRDAERALGEVAAGRATGMEAAIHSARQRVSHAGRPPQARTVSTPLLLKGLEFDHVLIPNAAHFLAQPQAHAKLFYVAISRATRTLTISSPTPRLRLPTPNL
ncbi:UvrD-helicase domain-containing protein [Aquincola tertiaricarbonis]|uniref:DNA 3'-5' helicase II n=1 Tax=Aquincola tertiaricarbonis TaxID=391953 RepID=A0ABY4SA06_AQUTE|nr:UvrD-helicase domain-containing protein [Aquincola tertiaricarbonis]URI09430.1 UvrD-helicase domain-containing protein [Aquincola tertiaricarbonis]